MQHMAWWSGSVERLAREHAAGHVVDHLARRLVESGTAHLAERLRAWQAKLALLANLAGRAPWHVMLGLPLLRLGKRADCVLLTDRAILVLEVRPLWRPAEYQHVEDIALDLADFHAGSRLHPIVPVLVATGAADEEVLAAQRWPLIWHHVPRCTLCTNEAGLNDTLAEIDRRIGPPAIPLDPAAWEAAMYRPVPNIVEAATLLYARHNVTEMATARADIANLTATTTALQRAIAEAQQARRHVVVFLTGIPGAGKTLCGLNAVFGSGIAAAFLTGNLPLVWVLREALIRDAVQRGRQRRAAGQHTESAIQPLMGFLRDNADRTVPPAEHVIVFDEAQRAWDAAYGERKFGRHDSEAGLFLDILGRHADYAVIVALIGNGQEISTGEGGLAEWGRALASRPDWSVVAAPGVFGAAETRQNLFTHAPPTARLDPALHLDFPVRSVRAFHTSAWVDAVLAGDAAAARVLAADSAPFFLTRSLSALRATLRDLARGERRAGLVCSAGAHRLRAEGLSPDFPHLDERAVANWFLNRWPDVRASDALEQPANQFACQGLELDFVGLCWGGDLVRAGHGGWVARKFRGTAWHTYRAAERIDFQINAYRVLLTRARYDTVIWVPKGDANDRTNDPDTMDRVAAFLQDCGVRPLEDSKVYFFEKKNQKTFDHLLQV
jgi:hypothetical protein